MFRLVAFISGFYLIQIAPIVFSIKTSPLPPHRSTLLSRVKYEPCRDKVPGKFVKDIYSCDKFYYCGVDEAAILVNCPHGMIFNDKKEICDFRENYFCIPQKKEEENISTTALEVQTTFAETSSTELGEELSTSTANNMVSTVLTASTTMSPDIKRPCPLDDASGLVFLPHKTDCRRYFICYHGTPFAQQCISELHWNSKTNQCDFPKNAGCSSPTGETSTAAIPDVDVISCPFRGEQIFPHPDHCNYFIYCINGYATVQQCPFFHFYDVQTKSCLWQTVVKCRVRKNQMSDKISRNKLQSMIED